MNNLSSSLTASDIRKKFRKLSIDNIKDLDLIESENLEESGGILLGVNNIKVGICAMEKKVTSKPMKEIIERLSEPPEELTIIIIDETCIFEKPVEDWPIVDCLISFYSEGFPLEKAQQYCSLRNPFVINDLEKQEILWDRRRVYQELEKWGIPTPTHYYVIRDPDENLIDIHKYGKKADKLSSSEHILPQINEIPHFNSDKEEGLSVIVESDNEEKRRGSKKQDFLEGDLYYSLNEDEMKDMVGESPNLNNLQKEFEDEKSIYSGSTLEKPSFTKKKNKKNLNLITKNEINRTSLHPPLTHATHNSGSKRSKSVSMGSKKTVIETMDVNSVSGTGGMKLELNDVEEFDEHIIISGKKLKKPLVEKPFNAENHEVNIYYPLSDGGGCKMLFRKVGNISSKFDRGINKIRKDGNYIFEEYIPTYYDIKIYTVGPDYCHAEARKSPALDGIVQRQEDGKEIRYPILLTPEEQDIARKIPMIFGQNVCGFDLLRSHTKSYVCDVNGWSFVKGSKKYNNDCASILKKMILSKLCPERLPVLNRRDVIDQLKRDHQMLLKLFSEGNMSFEPSEDAKLKQRNEELRSVVAVIRHGDRTPKQKMKMRTKEVEFLEFFNDQKDIKKEMKLKTPVHLQKMLNKTNELLNRKNKNYSSSNIEDNISKLWQLKSVLEKGGHFEGINRKISLRPLEFEGEPARVREALLILKWGGELTHSGEVQAEYLGSLFKNKLYPADDNGTSIISLHRSYRHDLKIYSSDEGRCQKTASAFCKGLLELEGELTPILVSMVRKDELAQELLDLRGQGLHDLHEIRLKMFKWMNIPGNLLENICKEVTPEEFNNYDLESIKNIGNPYERMKELYENVCKLSIILKEKLKLTSLTYYIFPPDLRAGKNEKLILKIEESKGKEDDEILTGCKEESPILIFKRWRKIEIDLYSKSDNKFNVSKIPHIYDSIRYEIIHNWELFSKNLDITSRIFELSKALCHFIVPAEHGITKSEKLDIGLKITFPLIQKIKLDLLNANYSRNSKNSQDNTPLLEENFWDLKKSQPISGFAQTKYIKTRLYFTSASHVYTLFNVLKSTIDKTLQINESMRRKLDEISMLYYLAHIVFRIFENKRGDPNDGEKYRLEICVSPGCTSDTFQKYEGHCVPMKPLIVLSYLMSFSQLEGFFEYFKNSDPTIKKVDSQSNPL